MSLLVNSKQGQLRHRLLPQGLKALGSGGITTLPGLKHHLQIAIEIEHSTIPPYLCALYSIQDPTSFAYRTIQSVVMEEMLHMILAANILNAIKGKPAINKPHFVPEYPTYLPFSDDGFLVGLGKFSQEVIDVFLQIELPAPDAAPPQPNDWHTLGQYYAAIKDGLKYVDANTPGGIFKGERSRQITPEHYYGGGGKIVPVYSLADALEAIDVIVGQGEGIDGTIEDPDHVMFGEGIEYAHYFKYNEIKYERLYRPKDSPQDPPTGPPVKVDWEAVYPMQDNPKMGDYPVDSEIYRKTREFNLTYMALLDGLHNACNGQPSELRQAIPLMYDLKYKALELMQIPIGDGLTAGPSFEWVKGT